MDQLKVNLDGKVNFQCDRRENSISSSSSLKLLQKFEGLKTAFGPINHKKSVFNYFNAIIKLSG